MAGLTYTYDADAPGRGGFGGALASAGSRRQKIVTGVITWDSSYPTGGELLTELLTFFRGGVIDALLFEQNADRIATFDKTGGKALLYTALGTEAGSTTNQSAIAIRFAAIGPA